MEKTDTKKLKKEDFFLSGAVESAPIFYATPTIGAAEAVNEQAVIINTNYTCRFYLGKEGITKSKNAWIKTPIKLVESSFKKWRIKWKKYDEIFYSLIIDSSKENWLENWKKIEKISQEFWLDSYKVENTDPFADELEKTIAEGLKNSSLDSSYLHELISPATPTLTQEIVIDRIKVKEGKMSKKDYLRKYWYIKGTWIGGQPLSEKSLLEDLQSKETLTDFEKRREIHKSILPKLDERTRNLILLLHILFLWREERKSYLQMMCICLGKVLDFSSEELKIDRKIIAWARPEELSLLKKNKDIFRERAEKSVFYLSKGSKKHTFLTGKEADTIINNFTSNNKVKELKGTIASKGFIKGRVRIVLREHHFSQFQEGEILVTTMTRPEYVPLMSKASAIITDEGGLTSHAAIVAREMRKPCIIGTKIATQVLQNGDEVEVNADKGIVRIL